MGKHLIEAAQKKHSTWKGSLGSWVRIVEGVKPPRNNFPAVRRTRKDADPVGNCAVFNIKDNDARLITYINYEMGTVTVLAALTLKEKRQLNRQQMERLSQRFHVSPAVFF